MLRRPAVLVDAFDTKCSDCGNERFSLADVGVISILEIGGIRATRVEEALSVLRLDDPIEIRRTKVFEALSGEARTGER